MTTTDALDDDAGDGVASGEVDAPAPSRVGRNMALLAMSQVVTATLGIALALFQPRLLGPEAQGRLRIAVSVWAVVEVLIGLGTSLLLQIETAVRPERARSLIRATLALRMIAFSVAIPFVGLFVVLADYGRRVDLLIVLGGVGVIGLQAATVGRAVLSGMQRMGTIAQFDVMGKVGLVVGVLAVLFAGLGEVAVASVGIVYALLAGVWMTTRALRHAPVSEVKESKRALLRAGKVFLITDLTVILYYQLDTFIVSVLTDERTLGIYAGADVIVGSLLFIPTIMMTALFPEIARVHEREPERVKELLADSFRTLVLAGALLGSGTIVVAHPLVVLLYGDEYEQTGSVLAVLGVMVFLAYLTILLGRFALATGRAAFWNRLLFSGVVLTIPLDLLLVRWTDDRYGNGAIGAALAYVVTEGVMVVFGVMKLDPQLFGRGEWVRYAKVALAVAAMLGVGWLLRDAFFVLTGAAGTLAFVAVVLATRVLTPAEWALVRRGRSAVLGRVRRRQRIS